MWGGDSGRAGNESDTRKKYTQNRLLLFSQASRYGKHWRNLLSTKLGAACFGVKCDSFDFLIQQLLQTTAGLFHGKLGRKQFNKTDKNRLREEDIVLRCLISGGRHNSLTMASCSRSNLHSHGRRLFRCFSDGTQLTEDDIHRIYYLDLRGILNDTKALKSFHSYIKNKHSGDPSEVKQFLDIHARAKDFLSEERLLTEDEIEELSDLGLRYDKEKKLSRARDATATENCLKQIQDECEKEIELSTLYRHFKEALLHKVKKHRHHSK